MINPVNRLILAARSEKKAQLAKAEVEAELQKLRTELQRNGRIVEEEQLVDWTENIIPLECDHSSMDSISEFNEKLRLRLMQSYRGHKWALNGIDVLCLNAAILTAKDSSPSYTRDGIELTFQTNHLAAFYLTNLIEDLINPGGRVVVTTSGLYNFEKLNNMSGLERLVADAEVKSMFGERCQQQYRQAEPTKLSAFPPGSVHSSSSSLAASDSSERSQSHSPSNENNTLYDRCVSSCCRDMMDGSDYHFKRSYAFSKLCNVAFTLELNARLQARNNKTFAVTFSPGLITKTGLFRYQDLSNWHNDANVMKKEKSVLWGAGALVYMSISDEAQRVGGGAYWSDANSFEASNAIFGKEFAPAQVKPDEVTTEQSERLWNLSSKLVKHLR